ncbi:MAG TPA: ABC transporter permease [Bryobacteraceae bacterium]|nr:ABC transporter permease [Bryobacteraceae bacterium]
MRERIAEIVRKEFRQLLRDPRMRVMLFLPPLIQLIVFGYAVNLDVDNARIAWQDFDRTAESRELRAAFEGSRRFKIVALPVHEADVQRLLDRGEATAVVRVLPNFARDVKRGDTADVQVLLDGTDSNTASIVSNYATQTIAQYASSASVPLQRNRLVGPTMASGTAMRAAIPSLDLRSRVWFNPDLRSRNYFVPGIIVNLVMLVTLMLTSMAIVREKEIGTMEQLMVTPIRPVELILGKTLPFALLGLFDTGLIVVLALVLFHLPFRGSLLLLFASTVLFLFTTLGSGLFISTISRTQQQAMMSTFLFFQPAFLLSGFAFPIHNMPQSVQYFTYLNPVRYFMDVVRGIFLKDTGISVLWPQLLAMAALGVSILTLSVMRFKKKLD